MKLYRLSPIKNEEQLQEAIRYIHTSCHKLCKLSLGKYLRIAGNIGIFCHYDDEYAFLTKLREKLTDPSDNIYQKYFRLRKPIVIPAYDDVPETAYIYLYIRKPDPYRYQVGDIDFYLEPEKYAELKKSLSGGQHIRGARVFERSDPDMIELYNPDMDILAYVRISQ